MLNCVGSTDKLFITRHVFWSVTVEIQTCNLSPKTSLSGTVHCNRVGTKMTDADINEIWNVCTCTYNTCYKVYM